MKEKILVINDDDSIRELTQHILQAKGYETFEAISGAAGLEQAVRANPDLILLDILMPDMDGYETCKRLKSSSETRDIPILFFSSLTSPKDKIKGLELGAVDFINNVADKGELIARVQTHLKIQALTRSLMDSNAQLIQKQTNLDDNLHAAAIIQRSFLPPENFKISSLNLASIWLPANLLGGDIFNTIQCCKDNIIFYMFDVSGHDVPSALVTVSVSQYLHQQSALSSTLSPKQIMLELDKEYPLERFDRYFTIFYSVLDISTGTFSYSCAGHPSAIVLSQSKGLSLLDKGGAIIGLNTGLPFEEGIETLSHGDKVFIYTDGVSEMKNLDDELYGTERLYDLLEKIKNKPVAEIVDTIRSSLEDFGHGTTAEDDISIMCFEFNGV
jgi:sigma-B regulation protein RsbU (phosphoserine phosphatase)